MSKDGLKHQLDQKIKKSIERIKAYNPDKIILYGSAARGDFNENSDIDFLILKKGVENIKPFERTYQVLKLLDEDAAYEPRVFSPAEIEDRVKRHDWYLEEAIRLGKVLYEKK